MTTSASPIRNFYFTANPAEIAQSKYAQQVWKERYAYIAMVAFTALAAVANYFLIPLVLPMTVLFVNFGVVSLASNFVVPRVLEWFAEAKKLKAQGDKETKIHEKLQEIHSMDTSELDAFCSNYGLAPSWTPWKEDEFPLIARISYWGDQSENLLKKYKDLAGEGKCREALEARLSALKAKLKAAYTAEILFFPDLMGKFKDSIAWKERTLTQWAFQIACGHSDAAMIAHLKGANQNPISQRRLEWMSIGQLAMERVSL